MKKFKLYYSNGMEVMQNDQVLVNDQDAAFVELILIPGTKEASQYCCDEGGFVLNFDSGDLQVWPQTDEDITLINRQKSSCE